MIRKGMPWAATPMDGDRLSEKIMLNFLPLAELAVDPYPPISPLRKVESCTPRNGIHRWLWAPRFREDDADRKTPSEEREVKA